MALPPPPTASRTGSRQWKDWFMKVQTDVVSPSGVTWSGINFSGSTLSDILTRPHSALQSIQGSVDGYHISSANAAGTWTVGVKSTSPTEGVGYATGAGGTVSQATSKSTGVTLDNVCGTITMNGAALGAGTIVSFTLTNSAISAGDVLVLNHTSVGTLGAYGLNAASANGSATIYVRNNTSGSLSQAIVLSFAVIKAVTS